MKSESAKVLREYGPYPGVEAVHGVSYDGQHVWFAAGDSLQAFDPESGALVGMLDVTAHAAPRLTGSTCSRSRGM